APVRHVVEFGTSLLGEKGEINPAQRETLQKIISAGNRMNRTIDALLKLSQVTRAEITLGNVDLSKLARQVCDDLQNDTTDRKVSFVIRDELTVKADAALLEIVLQNL